MKKLDLLVIVDQFGGGVEGEQIVHRGRHLEGALVAVAHGARNPLGIGDAGAYHAADFLSQGANPGRLRIAVVAMIDGRVAAAEVPNGRHHAALMLVVLAGVQQVMLAAVLIL